MQVKDFRIDAISKQDKLIADYLQQKETIVPLIAEFPEIDNFGSIISKKQFSLDKRNTLVQVLTEQFTDLTKTEIVENNILSLGNQNTYTVTTGHQLCLFTGPLYFIHKIISTIKLVDELNKKFIDKHFVPVFWMATEDHDLAEINHAFFFNKKVIWNTDQTGAVGQMNTTGINSVIDELQTILGESEISAHIIDLLRRAYSHADLSKATRWLVNELFGKFGLVIIDGNHRAFKAHFRSVIKHELFEHNGIQEINATNEYLVKNGYKTQVNPREINLFYLENNIRARIEKISAESWQVVDADKTFSKEHLEQLILEQPELFSPNVVVRPLYQETILPNIAYIGGPGELAYWLQLKSFFEKEKISFPILVLRDSALILNNKITAKMEKLGLEAIDFFENEQDVIGRIVHSDHISLEEEKRVIKTLFEGIAQKMKSADRTLEGTTLAEAQKQLAAIDHLEKKALKALKQKEEVKINQFQKIQSEIFPDGVPQERHDNFFQHQTAFGAKLIDDLYARFNPLAVNYHFMEQEIPVQRD